MNMTVTVTGSQGQKQESDFKWGAPKILSGSHSLLVRVMQPMKTLFMAGGLGAAEAPRSSWVNDAISCILAIS